LDSVPESSPVEVPKPKVVSLSAYGVKTPDDLKGGNSYRARTLK